MVTLEIKKFMQQFFTSARAEREDVLRNNIAKELSDLASRGMLSSGVAVNKICEVYSEELKTRFESAWVNIKGVFEKRKISFSKEVAGDVEELLKQLVNNEIDNLSRRIDSRFIKRQGPLDFKNSILIAIASTRNAIFPKLSAELNYYTGLCT